MNISCETIFTIRRCVRSQIILLSVVASLAFGPIASTLAGDFIAVEWNSSNSPVYRIDENTGLGERIGYSGFSNLNSMALNSSNVFYSVGGASKNTLISIDPNTGQGTRVATLSVSDIRGLAFSPNDVLYAGVGAAGMLYTIDVTSGVATFINSPDGWGIQSLDFSPNGILYSFDMHYSNGYGLGLVTVDTKTGKKTDVNPTVSGYSNEAQTLAFGPNGLYGACSSLYKIDTVTGVSTLVGGGGYSDIRGMAYETYVPEPSALAMLGMGAIGLMIFLWRHIGGGSIFHNKWMKHLFICCTALTVAVSTNFAQAQHAPWPADWNNWNDPALWATVGNPGNAVDSASHSGNSNGQGAVAYTYNIGKFEVTARQYTAFLNAKAASDLYGLYNANMYTSPCGCKIRQLGSSGSFTYIVDANGDGVEDANWVNRPVNYVSFWDAARFVNWLNNGQGAGDTETGAYTLGGYNGQDGRATAPPHTLLQARTNGTRRRITTRMPVWRRPTSTIRPDAT
jgi:hypothetical protein